MWWEKLALRKLKRLLFIDLYIFFNNTKIIWLKCDSCLNTFRSNTIYFQLFRKNPFYPRLCLDAYVSVPFYHIYKIDCTYQEYRQWINLLYLTLITPLFSFAPRDYTNINIFQIPFSIEIYLSTYICNLVCPPPNLQNPSNQHSD